MVEIRPGTVADAARIAALIRAFADLIVDDPAAAAPFWKSMSAAAHRRYLRSRRYRYHLACAGDELLGYIAMRDERHLFNLFVQRSAQRQGIARALWGQACRDLAARAVEGDVTVNASLNAVAVYRALGFHDAGAIVRTHGIAFLPMRCPPTARAA